MSSYLTAGANKLRRAREWATPTLKSSAFLERGVLTPEEFVRAGDELVYKCPTWQWESGDKKKAKNYLPSDKQYLVTRNVPCPTRASTLENSVAVSAHIDEDGNDGDDNEWMMSNVITPEEQQRRMDEKLEKEFDILDDDGETLDGDETMDGSGGGSGGEQKLTDGVANLTMDEKDPANIPTTQSAPEEEDEYADMEEFEDEGVMEDEAAIPTTGTTVQTTSTDPTSSDSSNIMKVRTYDLSITYDKYYQTPRVWIIGYASADSSQPLTSAQMFEDVMSDYANRTVTIDPHPHISGPHASIHPCQHGAVMKTIVKNLMKGSEKEADGDEDGQVKGPNVEMYLFIFLKFVSSIIPTINYDFTMDVAVSTEK